jgi:hypothetical protein
MGDLIIVQKLKVKRVYEKVRSVGVSGVGKDAILEDVSDGWVIVCEDYFSFLLPSKLNPVTGIKEVGPSPFKPNDVIIMKLEKEA